LDLFTERFHSLLNFIYFVENESYNEATCGSKRLHKLKSVLDHLNEIFKSAYSPGSDVSVDECLMMWKGRLSWKEYIPSKPARSGIKSFELHE
jgi:hypothetical protein